MSETQLVYVSRDPVRIFAGDVSYLRAHARIAAEAGFVPHMFCAASGSEVVETDYGYIHRVGSPFRPFRATAMPLHAPFISRAISDFLSSTDGPILVHGIGSWTYAAVRPVRDLRRSGRRCTLIASTYDVHIREARARLAGSRPYGRLRRWQNYLEYHWTRTAVDRREKQGYRESELIIVNYESVRELLLNGYVENEKIRLSPYSSEAAVLRSGKARLERKDASGPPLVVSLSRHDSRKGIDVFIRALAVVQASGIPFCARLIGTGPLLEAHRVLARDLGLGPQVIIKGAVEDSFAELGQGDVFVLPSLEEGSGSMSMIEAMQCGLAVVATNIDGIPEDVVNEDSALLVKAGDHEQLARALSRVLSDQSLRERLSRRSREVFEHRFSPDPFRKAILDTYERLGFKP